MFLVGIMKNQITGGKLPSIRDILSVLFYNMRVVNLSLQESTSLVLFIGKKLAYQHIIVRIVLLNAKNCTLIYETWKNIKLVQVN